jgi:hypothetical protein
MITHKKELIQILTNWINEVIEWETVLETCKALEINLHADEICELMELCDDATTSKDIKVIVDKFEYDLFASIAEKEQDRKDSILLIRQIQQDYEQ